MKKALLFTLLILGVAGCTREYYEPKGDAMVQIVLNTVDANEVTTRASYPIKDTEIKTIDMLVFDGATKAFIKRVKVEGFTEANGQYRFYAALAATSDPLILQFVINGRDDADVDRVSFGDLTVGMSEDIAVNYTLRTDTLTQETAEKIFPLIMWGRTTVTGITSGQEIKDVYLLRVAASVEVKVIPGASNHFKLLSATADSVAAFGQVAPYNYSSHYPLSPYPLLPDISSTFTFTLPVKYINYHDDAGGGFWNDYDDDFGAAQPNPLLYVYEHATTVGSYMTIIVKGEYNHEVCYYKVVPVMNEGYPQDIVRNHRYVLNIYRADGPGHPTFAAAAAGKPSNDLKFVVNDTNEDIVNIVSNGASYMGISNDVFELWGGVQAPAVLATVYTDALSDTDPPVISIVAGGMGIYPPSVNYISSYPSTTIGAPAIRKYEIRGTVNPGDDAVMKVTIDGMSLGLRVSTKTLAVATSGTLRMSSSAILTAGDSPWKVEIEGTPTPTSVWLRSYSTSTPPNTNELLSLNDANMIPTNAFYRPMLDSRIYPYCFLYYKPSAVPFVLKISGNFGTGKLVKRVVITG